MVTRRSLRWVTILILGLGGCEASNRSPTTVEIPAPGDIAPLLTHSAAEHLNSAGRFILAEPNAPGSLPIISSERAVELATAFLKTWGSFFEPSWEYQRGGDIDLASLRADARVYFAKTPYGLVTHSVHPADQKHYGPFYLVWFGNGTEPVLNIAVSAYDTDIGIDKSGKIVLPRLSGNDFKPIAVFPSGPRPISPEQAVVRAAAATGAQISGVPELLLASAKWTPQSAYWRVEIDRPVELRGEKTRARYTAREVYIGPDGKAYTPLRQQPSEVTARIVTGLATRENRRVQTGTTKVPVLSGMPLRFEVVSAVARER